LNVFSPTIPEAVHASSGFVVVVVVVNVVKGDVMDKRELLDWEYKCIQEESPECVAACPLHVDTRLFLKEVGRGDWKSAYKILVKMMPFPGIIGRICDHPCEVKCKRGEVGGPIAIGALERKCVETYFKSEKIQLQPQRGQRVAVLGSGLAGLTAALDLLKKGYMVTLFDRGDRLGGTLWNLPEGLLPREVINDETAILAALNADIRFNATLDGGAFTSICEEFDSVFIDRDSMAWRDLSLEQDGDGMISIEAITGATGTKGIYAGGGIRKGASYSPVTEAYEGRKAALSISRYLEQVSMDAGRENEGPRATRLFTSLKGIASLPRIRSADGEAGFTEEEARKEASRCIQCQCLECVKVCLYLERYKGYPKKYIREVFNNERVLPGAAHRANVFVNSCSTCGLCETVCPNDFFMGDLCLEARRTMLKENFMPPSFHEFALQDMAYSNSDSFSLCRHEPGREKSAFLYFPSCQLCATSPGEVLASYRYLRERLSGGVGIMLRCCGAPAYWAGRDDLFQETLEGIRSAWEEMGRPQVITACSTCQSLFGDHLSEMKTLSLWEVIEGAGLPGHGPSGALGVKGTTVAVVDPCITRNDRKTQESVRRIAGALGFAIEELPLSGEKPECCGYGGLMYNTDSGLARDVVARRVGISSHDYLAYCAMCRDNFAAAGKRVAHLIEHVFPTVGGNDPAGRGWISWTERRTNRTRVKKAILRDLGEEKGTMMEAYEAITLQIAPEVRRKIDDRRILEDDIRKVIDSVERTGKRLMNRETGHYRAYCQLENVTFWVDYTPEEKHFTIHNAYSHRMKIERIRQ
jgi:glutamate synthase (NADPH) small chain